MSKLKKLFLLVQDEYNERASIRTFNKFRVDEFVVRQSEVLNTELSRFCEGRVGASKLKS